MQSIGLGEALSTWFTGGKLDNVALYGLSVVWWARAAKVATWLAGLVVLIDLIGPARVQEFALKAFKRRRKISLISASVLYALYILVDFLEQPDVFADASTAELVLSFAIGLPIVFAVGTIACFGAITALLYIFLAGLRSARAQLALRVASVVVLSVAFFVDLLAS